MHLVKKLIKKHIYDRIPRKDLHGFDYTVKELVGMWENSAWAVKNWHGQILSDDFLQYKTSDTIFILGSGPSINDITSQQWDVIASHDSIGFNWWFVHDFVPDFYMFQSASDKMLDVLKDKYSSYQKTPFLIRGSAFAKGEFDFKDERLNLLKNNPVYFVNEYPIAGRCSIEPEMLYRYMDALGFMSHGRISKFIPKWRGTLGLSLMLAYQMGYDNIVLCGMDMHKSNHFWDYSPYDYLKSKYLLPEIGQANISSFTRERLSPNTVPVYVYSLHEWMKQKSGTNIFVANPKTVLYPKISVYAF